MKAMLIRWFANGLFLVSGFFVLIPGGLQLGVALGEMDQSRVFQADAVFVLLAAGIGYAGARLKQIDLGEYLRWMGIGLILCSAMVVMLFSESSRLAKPTLARRAAPVYQERAAPVTKELP